MIRCIIIDLTTKQELGWFMYTTNKIKALRQFLLDCGDKYELCELLK